MPRRVRPDLLLFPWQEALGRVVKQLGCKPAELADAGKSVNWKLAAASALKNRTAMTKRWLATNLLMGNLNEVSLKVAAWSRRSDPALQK